MKEVVTLIHVIGTDASGLEQLAESLQRLILSTKKIAGPERILESLPEWWGRKSIESELPEMCPSDKPKQLISWLKEQTEPVVVLASGDPLWFGIGRALIESFPSERLQFHPAPTSLQLAFARLGRPWQDASWISLHGRDPGSLAKALHKRPKALAVLTDPTQGGVETVRHFLNAAGLEENYALWIFERLGHPQEQIHRILPTESITSDLHPLHLVVLLATEASIPNSTDLPLFGINDGFYLQHSDRPGLMTKREVRVQLLADLELPEQGVLWDIGAGVGSIGLEALRIRPKIQLIAVEKRSGGAALIKANAKRLNVDPFKVLETDALNLIQGRDPSNKIKPPNRVLLGGGGTQRELLLKAIIKQLQPFGIVVIPLVTLEAIEPLIRLLKGARLEVTIKQHQSSRGIPLSEGTRLEPLNPVFILKGKRS